jgi:hypothetical protein
VAGSIDGAAPPGYEHGTLGYGSFHPDRPCYEALEWGSAACVSAAFETG